MQYARHHHRRSLDCVRDLPLRRRSAPRKHAKSGRCDAENTLFSVVFRSKTGGKLSKNVENFWVDQASREARSGPYNLESAAFLRDQTDPRRLHGCRKLRLLLDSGDLGAYEPRPSPRCVRACGAPIRASPHASPVRPSRQAARRPLAASVARRRTGPPRAGGDPAEEDLQDHALAGVSVTLSEVQISPDLKHALCFVEPLGGLQRARRGRRPQPGLALPARPSGPRHRHALHPGL